MGRLFVFICPPRRIRTSDRLLKRQLLYRAELWAGLLVENKAKKERCKVYNGKSNAQKPAPEKRREMEIRRTKIRNP